MFTKSYSENISTYIHDQALKTANNCPGATKKILLQETSNLHISCKEKKLVRTLSDQPQTEAYL